MDKRTEEILKKYHPDPNEAVWFHKQSKQWIAKHKDLEVVATKAGIIFDEPQVELCTPEAVTMIVFGKMPTEELESGFWKYRNEWSVGEANSTNTQNKYYGSMAEKRGKDRVILKLLGLHGFVYSDQEADEWKDNKDEKKESEEDKEEFNDKEGAYGDWVDQIIKAMSNCDNTAKLINAYNKTKAHNKYKKLNGDQMMKIFDAYEELESILEESE